MSNNFHLQLYRGTTAQNNAYTGLAGEITADTQAGNIRLHDGSKAGGYVVASMPVGSIIPFAGTTIPDGYLLCDGSAISRTTYSSLFAAIGTTYGEGDGNSTFNLPNLIYRIPCYDNNSSRPLGATSNGALPNIKGTIGTHSGQGFPLFNVSSSSGAFYDYETSYNIGTDNSTSKGTWIGFDASLSNSIYADAATSVYPASVKMYYVIHY